MFTGIIETTAKLRSKGDNDLWLDVPFADELGMGQSVACNGACLTVVEKDAEGFKVELMEETKEVTYLDELNEGDLINIERAMRADGRFDGHIVQGHVDGVGIIKNIENIDEYSKLIGIEIGKELNKYIVQKGSICLDGISLTVVSVDNDTVKVEIIPHTWNTTNLKFKKEGDKLHVEVDIMAKYLEKFNNGS